MKPRDVVWLLCRKFLFNHGKSCISIGSSPEYDVGPGQSVGSKKRVRFFFYLRKSIILPHGQQHLSNSALSYGHAKKIEKQLKKEVRQLLHLAERAEERLVGEQAAHSEQTCRARRAGKTHRQEARWPSARAADGWRTGEGSDQLDR